RLDRHEPVAAVGVGTATAGAGEVRVERRGVLVDLVAVASARIGLPDLDQRASDRPPVLVEDPPGDGDPLADRLARMLPRQVVVELADRVLAEDRPVERVELLRQRDERPFRHPPAGRAVARVVDLDLRPSARVVREDDRVRFKLRHQSRPFVFRARSAVSSSSDGASVSPTSSTTRSSQPVAARTSSTSTPGWIDTRVSSPSCGSRMPRSVITTRRLSPRLVVKSSRSTNARAEWRSITKTCSTPSAISG